MKAILTAIAGPHAGLTFELPENKTLRLGRASEADQSFPDDLFMSSLHVLIDRSKPEIRLGDLESRNGTFVNGERVVTAILRDGDRVQFGATELELFLSAPPGHATAEDTLSLHELVNRTNTHLYLLLDAAQGSQVRDLLQRAVGSAQSLYEGESETKLEAVAPYLVQIDRNSILLDTLDAQVWWGKHLSLYLSSSQVFAPIRKHLRRFLLVKGESGEQLYFRFYDPRVLPAYLATCTAEERQMFFGPISQFWIETAERSMLSPLHR